MQVNNREVIDYNCVDCNWWKYGAMLSLCAGLFFFARSIYLDDQIRQTGKYQGMTEQQIDTVIEGAVNQALQTDAKQKEEKMSHLEMVYQRAVALHKEATEIAKAGIQDIGAVYKEHKDQLLMEFRIENIEALNTVHNYLITNKEIKKDFQKYLQNQQKIASLFLKYKVLMYFSIETPDTMFLDGGLLEQVWKEYAQHKAAQETLEEELWSVN